MEGIRCSMCDGNHTDDTCPYYDAKETRKTRAQEAERKAQYNLAKAKSTESENRLLSQGYKKCKTCKAMIKPEDLQNVCCYHPGGDSRDGMAFYWSCCSACGEDAKGCIVHKNHIFE